MQHLLRKSLVSILTLVAVAIIPGGCAQPTLPGDYGDSVKFSDSVETNAQPNSSQIANLTLTKSDGSSVKIGDLASGKNVLLVVSRGLVGSLPTAANNAAANNTAADDTAANNTAANNTTADDAGAMPAGGNSFCIYCSTQTSRLVANYEKFKKRNTEVVVIFPVVDSSNAAELQNFAAKVQGAGKTSDDFPFPIVLDVELMVVDALGIRDDLSKPASYIFDSQGQLRFGYVGQSISDRPSVQALLDQLDRINQPR